MKQISFVLFIGLLLLGSKTKAQFNQFYASLQGFNPSFVGAAADLESQESVDRLSLNMGYSYSFPSNFVSIGWERAIQNNHAIGLQINNFNFARIINETNYGFSYAYNQSIGKKLNIRAGIQSELYSRFYNVERENSQGISNIDPNSVRRSTHFINLASGISILSKSFYLGVAGRNLFEPNISLLKGIAIFTPRFYVINSGANFNIVKKTMLKLQLQPSIMAFGSNINTAALAGNMNIAINKFLLGMGYDSQNEIITNLGYQWKGMRFLYSINNNRNRLNDLKNIDHSLSLIYHFRSKGDGTGQNIISPYYW